VINNNTIQRSIILLLSMSFFIFQMAYAEESIEGYWYRQSTGWVVEITLTESVLNGVIIDDRRQPKATTESLIGLQILSSFRPKNDKLWRGSIYDPEDNITANGSIRLIDTNRLKVKACVFGFLCGSEIWSRQLNIIEDTKP